MVGVPGRSKGCNTCRKRKKGCDLRQPECGQCKERGITCGGYDTDRIFVYQSAGFAKRGTFASTPKRDHDAAAWVPAGASAPHFPSRDVRITPVRAISKTGNHSPGQPRPISVILPAGLTRSAYSERSIEAFLHMYIPGGDFQSTNVEGKDFVNMLPMLSIRDKALQMAVLAIGTAALGKTTHNEDLIRQGKSLYGKALTETAVALRNPTRATSEAVFAIPRVMALFEILFGAEPNSSAQARSWLSHAEGEVALIVSRGPQAYSESEEAHLLFVNARFRPLIAACRRRQATILDEQRWKTLPWTGRVKTPNDTLLDILCSIPGILEAGDKLAYASANEKRKEALRVYTIAKCWTLHVQLQTWLTVNSNEIYTPDLIDSTALIYFPDLETACLTVRYWVTALLIFSSLDRANGIDFATDNALSHPDRPHPRYFARLIARSARYFFQEQYGITGATAISFPLGNALYYMKNNPALDREYLATIMKAWNDPMLPSAIRDFLASMKRRAPVPSLHTHSTPTRPEQVC
ncbi:Nn.00g008300.m01.CDS01 [Neocucurbitaria sp. VM-36]